MTDSKREATITLPSDREIVITREFDAPARLVWDAYTKPELVRQWHGLRSGTTTVCDIDFRVGGRWRYVQKFPDVDGEVGFTGEYLAIELQRRIVNTEEFEMIPGDPATVTTTFEEADGRTTVTSHNLFVHAEQRDGAMQSGMEHGVNEMYERLDEYLATVAP